MGIRTVEEYKKSLRDGRRVYMRGQKVDDVTTHPILGLTVDTVAQGFALTSSENPEVRNLFTAPHPKTGELINRYFITPGNTEDLIMRTKMIQRSIELTGGDRFLNVLYFYPFPGVWGERSFPEGSISEFLRPYANLLEYFSRSS
jgi:aromatic ring hydroxylase